MIDRSRCKGCELCFKVCPKKLLRRSSQLSARGIYPCEASDPTACIGCLQCVLVCPDVAITVEDDTDDEQPTRK
ncbi:MAG: 4Fe-4S binding protein [bacterium]|nr:4Fe-4S binding protein [bacterium]